MFESFMNVQARESLDLQPALWQAAADAAPTPFVLISAANGTILYSNRMGNLLTRGPVPTAGRPAHDIFPKPIAALIEQVRQTGQPARQTRLQLPPAPHRPDASVWDVNYTPVPSAGIGPGGAPAILLTAQDVTRHVRARRQTAATRGMDLHAVLQQIPAAVLLLDSGDGTASFQNDCLSQVLGHPKLSRADARDMSRGWALHEDGTRFGLEGYLSRRAFCQGETIEGEPIAYRRLDGRIVNLEIYAGPIRDKTGRIVAAIAIVYDVTERKRQADALRDSHERQRLAVEAAGLATWDVDLVRGATEIDSAFAQLLKLPAEAYRGGRAEGEAFVHPDDVDQARAALEAAVVAKGQFQNEMRAVTSDGRVLWLSNSGGVVLDKAGQPMRVAGVVRDVTGRRSREDALRAALATRELLLREADHRIKNSLQLISNILALQKTRLPSPDLNAALDDAISRVQAVAEAHRALHQSNDLRSVDFGTMLNDLCHHAGRLSTTITFTCACPERIDLDTERAIPLGLIISELLTNSAKYAYGAQGGAVAVLAVETGGQITIRVADRGRGIAAETRNDRGIGSKIVGAIARQIGATVETASNHLGTEVTLTFASSPPLAYG
jgi:PAS domain S-box-containing protein